MIDRKCKTCGDTYPTDQFPLSRNLGEKRYYRHVCKPCYNESKNQRQQRLGQKLREYKSQFGCCDCGYNENPYALDFDHIRDTKVSNVSTLVSMTSSWDKIVQEIEKCEIRCANCHRIKTHGEVC